MQKGFYLTKKDKRGIRKIVEIVLDLQHQHYCFLGLIYKKGTSDIHIDKYPNLWSVNGFTRSINYDLDLKLGIFKDYLTALLYSRKERGLEDNRFVRKLKSGEVDY